MTNLGSVLKSRDITLSTKVCIVKAVVFPVVMYGCELDHIEGWAPKNGCFWIVVLEKTLKSPLDCREIKLVNPEGNQPWTFIGRIVAEAEALVLWPPDVKNQLLGKDPDSGKDWRQKDKGVVEDEMVGWHHWLNGLGFEQTPGDGEGQRSLACCSPWDWEETQLSDWTTTKERSSFQEAGWGVWLKNKVRKSLATLRLFLFCFSHVVLVNLKQIASCFFAAVNKCCTNAPHGVFWLSRQTVISVSLVWKSMAEAW